MKLARRPKATRLRKKHGKGLATNRKESANGSNHVTLSARAIDLLLTETLVFLLSAGVERRKLSSELRDKAQRILNDHSIKPPRVSSHQRLVAISSVVHDWHRDRRYTDKETGEPIELTKGELRILIARRVPARQVDAALAWMRNNEVVKTLPGGLLALKAGRQVIIGHPRALAMERAATLAPQFLRTTLRNARTANAKERELDQYAQVPHLPEKFIPVFRQLVHEKLEPVLVFLDDWLEDHNDPTFDGRTAETSIHVHTHTGEPRPLGRAMNVARGKKRPR